MLGKINIQRLNLEFEKGRWAAKEDELRDAEELLERQRVRMTQLRREHGELAQQTTAMERFVSDLRRDLVALQKR
jgi:hypothetical protein